MKLKNSAFRRSGTAVEDPEEAWSITRDTILTTAAENIPVKRAVRRPWLMTETMDIIDQKKEARLKGNHDEWKRLKGVYKARSKVDLELFYGKLADEAESLALRYAWFGHRRGNVNPGRLCWIQGAHLLLALPSLAAGVAEGLQRTPQRRGPATRIDRFIGESGSAL